MNWKHLNFDWNHARAFLVTAEEGSFSGAARALNVAQPTIGRQITALEDELGVTLFERVGRGVQVTEAGLALLEHVRVMGEAASRMSLVATGKSEVLEGTVTITASEIISAYVLPTIVRDLRKAHPGIEIEILSTNDTADLMRREADIAVRAFRPQQPDLVARKIGERRACLYATPGYLESIGNPTTLEALSGAEFINFNRSPALMTGLNAAGLSLSSASFPLITSSHLVQWELAKQGAGICVMMKAIGDSEPRVQAILPDQVGFDVPLWLTTHREVQTSRRVRVVFEWLADTLTPLMND